MISRGRHILVAFVALVAALGPASLQAAVQMGYEDLLGYLTDLDRLPAIEPGVYCRQFSSYDRASRYDKETDSYINWDANGDAGHYLRVDEATGEGVMAEMEGPGCIFRIWSANPQGVIRFYLDGDTSPTYEWDFRALCAGEIDPFIEPLVWKREKKTEVNTASNCYVPIPFAKSCKVTGLAKDKNGKPAPPRQYYIIDYRVFPEDWKVKTFRLPLSDPERLALERTAKAWATCGSMEPDSLDQETGGTPTLAPGDSWAVVELTGPGVIRQFNAKLRSKEKWATRKVLLRVYWDGAASPAIDCPIGDFFGEPHDDATYRSYPMGITEKLNYCYFPMPFRKSARVMIVNEGREPATVDLQVVYREQQVLDNWALFHAKWRGEIASTSFDYPLIEATGTGKLVGICVFPHNHHGGWWGEGDEKVYVDGEKFPSWFGTGSEDYFGDAWGIREMHNPSHGFPQHKGKGWEDGDFVGCYRWHLGDSIPFYKSFVMTIENYTGKPNVQARNDYSSVAYWYQMPGGTDFFSPTPVIERIPAEFVARGAIEAENMLAGAALKPGMSLTDDADLPEPLSRGRGVKLTGKVGSTFPLPVRVDKAGRHTISVGAARGVKASRFEVLFDGQPVGKAVTLPADGAAIAIRFTGDPVEGDRCELIVDYLKLDVFRNMITDWMVIGPFATGRDRAGLDKEYPPEKEIDLSKKYAGRDGEQVGWQRLSREDGMIDLTPIASPSEFFVAYATCLIHAPEATKATLLIGSDDGVKVWFNGKLVHSKRIDRALAPDSDRVPIELKQGANTLLVKIEQGAGGAGLAARIADPKDEITYSLPR